MAQNFISMNDNLDLDKLMKKIPNDFLRKIYLQFSYKYYSSEVFNSLSVCSKIDFKDIFLFSSNSKFITYSFTNVFEIKENYDIKDSSNNALSSNQVNNVIICSEKTCFILNQVDSEQIKKYFDYLRTQQFSLLNASSNIKNAIGTDINIHSNEEIHNFCDEFHKDIESYKFIKYTIRPIICYLIRRNFQPFRNFTDPSFFTFSHTTKFEEFKIKEKIRSLLNTFDDQITSEIIQSIKNIEKSHQNEMKQKTFNKKEFIFLRKLFANGKSTYNLVLHRESLTIFMMKEFINVDDKFKNREMNFCLEYNHRCFSHFYGTVQNMKNENIGVLYEFLCNNTLKANTDTDNFFILMTMNRLFQGIEYLQSKSLIHRDLKPENILLDQDNVAFIIDFETIRKINDEDDPDAKTMTFDFATFSYSSPEQDKGDQLVSFPTDVYSFGNIIYYLYEKENNIKSYSNKDNLEIKKMKNASKNIQNLFERCIVTNQDERIKIQDIKKIIKNEFNSFENIENLFLKDESIQVNSSLINYFFEFLYINKDNDSDLDKCMKYIHAFHNLLKEKEKEDISSLYFQLATCFVPQNENCIKPDYYKVIHYLKKAADLNNVLAMSELGSLYLVGHGVEKDVEKANYYLELAAKQGDLNAINSLGSMYLNRQDYDKAKECYELLAQKKDPRGFTCLGIIYINGFGVEEDIAMAKYYFELAAQQNDPNGLYNLGSIYLNVPVYRDINKALLYLIKASELNNPLALFNLGLLYLNDLQDYTKARYYLEKSAELFKNTDAITNLGIIYFNGYGVKKDFYKAKEYLDLAMQQGNINAVVNLGYFYKDTSNPMYNLSKAAHFFEQAAKHNHPASFMELATIYEKKHNYKEVAKYLKKAANIGNQYAIFNLGKLYYEGRGVERDINTAEKYFQKAAASNNPNILYNIGLAYDDDDFTKAEYYYKLAAQQNNADAIFNLGNLYYKNNDYKNAFYYFDLAAKLYNYSDAFLFLGICYSNGFGVEKNYQYACYYYEQAAICGSSDACVNLANIYIKGNGINKDLTKAEFYLKQAFQLGDPVAMLNLGILYNEGIIEQNYVKAREYFEIAAAYDIPGAIYNLGFIYLLGLGVERDYQKARKFFEKLEKRENNSLALLNLAYIYLGGLGVPKDIPRTMHYYELAAKQGNATALLNLGTMYSQGNGVEQNYEKAIEYYKKSAKLQNSFAYLCLGDLYENGKGVPQDYLKAKKYYEISSRMNNSYALLSLGQLYEKGLGVKQNYFTALQYYTLSSKLNNSEAFFYLATLYSTVIPSEPDIPKTIQLLNKCIETYSEKWIDSDSVHHIPEKFVYRSKNDLGLIYLTFYNDIDKATNFLKEAAFQEFPFAQNNFGLLNQFYLNNVDNAKYMYQKASKNGFYLAEYNLGYLMEKDDKMIDALDHYIKASDNEDQPLIFHNFEHVDLRLETSKTFIICMTNLKICYFYLSQPDKAEAARKYFIRSFSKIISDKDKFMFHFNIINNNDKQNPFSYLKSFILNSPKFNLINQPDLNPEIKKIISECGDDLHLHFNCSDEECRFAIEDPGELFDSVLSHEIENHLNCECLDDCCEEQTLNDCRYETTNLIRDQNKDIKDIFLDEILDIIQVMESILYSDRYSILFGRISLFVGKNKRKENIYPRGENINDLFYEGFGFDLL
ncbi:hypothetical protein M9Y10_026261 [Tritrichomonas musculus]|uniref:Protein kinase domain-containing protein n=2 Tax=Tritrichomonas musculus TaxID=1915356 RepID=A0ABR2H893_9EUKA